MDSIYTQCSQAARRLMGDAGHEPFTEDAVVQTAAAAAEHQGAPWTEEEFGEAERHAPQVLAALYRSTRLVRFGPVAPEDAPLTGEPDYVRQEGKILYGASDPWEDQAITTPNGPFDPIRFNKDPIFKVGRRKSSVRDDLTPWEDQQPVAGEPRPDVSVLRRDNAKLRAALAQEPERVAHLEAEVERLKTSAASRNGHKPAKRAVGA